MERGWSELSKAEWSWTDIASLAEQNVQVYRLSGEARAYSRYWHFVVVDPRRSRRQDSADAWATEGSRPRGGGCQRRRQQGQGSRGSVKHQLGDFRSDNKKSNFISSVSWLSVRYSMSRASFLWCVFHVLHAESRGQLLYGCHQGSWWHPSLPRFHLYERRGTVLCLVTQREDSETFWSHTRQFCW